MPLGTLPSLIHMQAHYPVQEKLAHEFLDNLPTGNLRGDIALRLHLLKQKLHNGRWDEETSSEFSKLLKDMGPGGSKAHAKTAAEKAIPSRRQTKTRRTTEPVSLTDSPLHAVRAYANSVRELVSESDGKERTLRDHTVKSKASTQKTGSDTQANTQENTETVKPRASTRKTGTGMRSNTTKTETGTPKQFVRSFSTFARVLSDRHESTEDTITASTRFPFPTQEKLEHSVHDRETDKLSHTEDKGEDEIERLPEHAEEEDSEEGSFLSNQSVTEYDDMEPDALEEQRARDALEEVQEHFRRHTQKPIRVSVFAWRA